MNQSVVVPIHVDGLHLVEEKLIAEATADFAKLPYNDSVSDFNYEIPYLSESFVSKPFHNSNLLLPPGVHLHWALPAALLNGVSNEKPPLIFTPQKATGDGDVAFPVVPDRWLIIKKTQGRIAQSWVVESNYLHPAGDHHDNPYDGISYPLIDSGRQQPYRYLGRHYSLGSDGRARPEELRISQEAEYLPNLTSIGYGSPVFSAFYPNCHSVFGFHDGEVTPEMLATLEYEVWGWYSDASKDPINLLRPYKGKTAQDFADVIKHKLNWEIADLPFDCNGMMCCGTIKYQNFVARKDALNPEGLAVTVGNTGTEALSTLLGSRLNQQFGLDNHQRIIEDQLEALQLAAKLAGQELDTGKKLLQAMHEKGFSQVDGGLFWNLSVENTTAPATSRPEENNPGVVLNETPFDLPESVAARLRKLNSTQQNHDRANDELISLQQQLFADWYKYMVSCYHDDVNTHTADTDRIKFLIDNDHFKQITLKQQEINNYYARLDKETAEVNRCIAEFNSGGSARGNTFMFGADTPAASFALSPEASLGGHYVAAFQGQAVTRTKASDFFAYAIELGMQLTAVSILVNISSNRPAANAYLLQIGNEPDTTVGPDAPGLFWSAVFIDGVALNPHKNRKWADIPKDRWVHLHFVADKPIAAQEITLFQRLGGKMAGLRLFGKKLSEAELFYDRNVLGLKKLVLRSDKAPRFWLPNDPVVLIAGSDVKMGSRHAARPQLDCVCFDFTGLFERNQSAHYALNEFPPVADLPGITTMPGNPEGNWNPTLLQWEVIVQDNVQLAGPYSTEFAEDFITSNYSIKTGDYDLNVATDAAKKGERIKLYTGSTILSAHAKTHLQSVIGAYLLAMDEEELAANLGLAKADLSLPPYQEPMAGITRLKAATKKSATEAETQSIHNELFTAFQQLIAAVAAGGSVAPFFRHAVAAAVMLSHSHYLSQSLGGFNAALLQLHETMQLPVADPVSFLESRAVTARAAKLIGPENKRAPLPLNQFNPIKTGTIRLNQLGVIDNYGQVITIPLHSTEVRFSHSFTEMPQGKEAFLPPRIVQPARLNFRWVSAANPASTPSNAEAGQDANPVCGWLVPNNLDVSLMVYDAEGNLLGLIHEQNTSGALPRSTWAAAPGNRVPMSFDQIPNQDLRAVVSRLVGKSDFADFVELLDDTLQQIDPASFAQHLELAMLMGRPIAVVKAAVGLEVKGLPAINQSWDYFNVDLGRNHRETNSWDNVKFPVLIGEPGILNDGVLGFWDEEDNVDVFQSVYPETIDKRYFVAHEDGAHTFSLSLNDAPKILLLLLDPRGEAHATTGILPAKSISLPASRFKPALARMSVSFFTRPVLMPQGSVAISLPEEAGYSWSWLTMEAGKWAEVSTTGVADKELFVNAFDDGASIWQDLLLAGWIQETEAGKALILPKNHWAAPTPLLRSHLPAIQQLLDAGHIVPMNAQGVFSPGLLVREGWLNLTVNN
jgi:hypothetical protein